VTRGLTGVMLALLLVGCGRGSDRAPGGSAADALLKRPCGDLLKPAAASATPPADVPLTGVTWFDKKTQGRTDYYFGTLPGAQVANARDQLMSALTAAGYTVKDTDQEGNAEADGLFAGPHEGSVQVTPYCQGHLQLRLRLGS
jgi:hypothetical protein